MNESKPSMKCSKKVKYCQNHSDLACYGKSIAITCLRAMRQSSLRWHDFYSGFYMELGNLNMDVGLFINLPPVEWGKDKGKLRSTDALFRGGLNRSSGEISVMETERRVQVIRPILFNNSPRG